MSTKNQNQNQDKKTNGPTSKTNDLKSTIKKDQKNGNKGIQKNMNK
ncbi:hypothetical protein [Aequorivita echinoideorum]|uniref:Uncharacterized protein n=1 Tax=Aequorivita echinoideorum TaxID=1549647 RepID=A0ABS5S9X9_9FLAO|nr:hypothetical protein [Aequorivita echinoideorum]MBT0609147.1 hypothetical protein [Aequorivita echinoideorum]